jgi:hypothetical protein
MKTEKSYMENFFLPSFFKESDASNKRVHPAPFSISYFSFFSCHRRNPFRLPNGK